MASIWDTLARLDAPAVLATLVRVTGSAPASPGGRMVVHPDGRLEGTLGGGRLEHRVIAEARVLLAEDAPHTRRTYRLNPGEDQCCGGEVEVFFERIAPAPRVLLFGAGHVGQAVARALAPLPFRVSVLDERPGFVSRERFPDARDLLCGPPLERVGEITTSEHSTYALVFTHSHNLDLALVSVLLGRPLRYLGLIGSRTKWARFRAALLERGVPAADLARVRTPIGIGVGGKAPAEIAASVAAELLAVRDGLVVTVTSGVPGPEAPAIQAPR